jgi:hypothetical protein
MGWQTRIERDLRSKGYGDGTAEEMAKAMIILESAGDRFGDALYELTKENANAVDVVANVEKVLLECASAKETLRGLI